MEPGKAQIKVVLAIGGLDPSGGAGIGLDCAVIRAAGAHPCSVATVLTAQSGSRFEEAQGVCPRFLRRSLELVLADLPVASAKIGALWDRETVRVVAAALVSRRGPRVVVIDPVLESTTGGVLLDREGRQALCDELLPLATVVTPNRRELEILSEHTVDDRRSASQAASVLLDRGCPAVLIKGGHFTNSHSCADWLVTREGCVDFEGRRLPVGEVRGTGCALASAVATFLARGCSLFDSVHQAKQLVARGLERSESLTAGAAVLRFD